MSDYDGSTDKGPSHAFYSAHGGPAKNQRRVGNQFMQTSAGMLPPQKTAPPAVVMRKADGTVAPPLPFTAIPADMAAWAFQPHIPMAAPKTPVQARGDMDGSSVHEAAAEGVRGSGSALPHAERIQAAFGPDHDISHVRAHVGGAAAAASEAIGAEAYATGHQSAFRDAPDASQDFQNSTLNSLCNSAPVQMKKPTSEIREEYQVKDDEMTNWSPKAFGIPIPFSGERRMTETEGELLDGMVLQKGLIELFTFQDIHDKAFSESTARYPPPGSIPAHVPKEREREWLQNDGHRDAFRHCYWNALLTSRYGEDWAKNFATAHEGAPGNPAEREAMDLWNNEVGRKIAKDNPRANEKQLADKVQVAVTSGQLVVVNQSSELAYSNTVKLWEHGFTGNKTADGKIKADGDASAKSG